MLSTWPTMAQMKLVHPHLRHRYVQRSLCSGETNQPPCSLDSYFIQDAGALNLALIDDTANYIQTTRASVLMWGRPPPSAQETAAAGGPLSLPPVKPSPAWQPTVDDCTRALCQLRAVWGVAGSDSDPKWSAAGLSEVTYLKCTLPHAPDVSSATNGVGAAARVTSAGIEHAIAASSTDSIATAVSSGADMQALDRLLSNVLRVSLLLQRALHVLPPVSDGTPLPQLQLSAATAQIHSVVRAMSAIGSFGLDPLMHTSLAGMPVTAALR